MKSNKNGRDVIKKKIRLLGAAFMMALLLSACGAGDSVMPGVNITMNSTNEELKEAYGNDYEDSGYGDGETTIHTKMADTDVTVHVNWNGDKIKNIWMETLVDKDNYSAFEKMITDFYPDLELQNQMDVVENGSATYKNVDISYIHFIDQGNVFLYVGSEKAEAKEAKTTEE